MIKFIKVKFICPTLKINNHIDISIKTRNFKKFLSDDGNESVQSSSPSLTRFNIQASVTKIVTSESRESP